LQSWFKLRLLLAVLTPFCAAALQELIHVDVILVTGADGHGYRLLRLHVTGDPENNEQNAAACYFCRPQLRSVLISSNDARLRSAHERLSARSKLAEEQEPLDDEWTWAVDGDDSELPSKRPAPLIVIDTQMLQLFKAAKVVGTSVNLSNQVQIWSTRYAHDMLLHLGERADTLTTFLDAASQPRGKAVSGPDFVTQGGTGPLSFVVPMPAALPDRLRLPPDAAARVYALPPDALAAEWAPWVDYLTEAINLERAGRALQPSTVDKTSDSIRRVLGFAYHLHLDGRAAALTMAAGGAPPPYRLAALADGTMLAAYVRFSMEIRKKAVDSICSELGDVIRVLRCLLKVGTHEGDKEQLDQLISVTQRLCCQLHALPAARAAPPTVVELAAAGKYVDVAEIWIHIDATYDALAPLVARAAKPGEEELRTPELARRVHDMLMLLLCLRDYPVRRPGCMEAIKAPGSTAPCTWPGCIAPGCSGNGWVRAAGGGWALQLVHFKTAGTHQASSDMVPSDSRAGLLLAAYTGWARPLLLKVPTEAMWLSARGKAFGSGGFAEYLPKLLRSLAAKITWTALRHIVATGLIPHLDEQELDGLAAAMQTSVRKLKEVYDWQKEERARAAGLEAYRRAGAAAQTRQAAADAGRAEEPATGGGEREPELQEGTTARPAGAALGRNLFGWEDADEALLQAAEELGDEVARAAAARAPDLQVTVHAPFDQFLVGCRPKAPPRLAAPPQPRGAPVRFNVLPGRAFLKPEQVEELERRGQGKALKAAFAWLYGTQTATTNLRWLRRKLQAG